MTSAILLCGGSGERWNNHLGITKHMVPIGREPLIIRTCRQLRSRLGIEPWVVASDPQLVKLVGPERCLQDYDQSCCSAGALSTEPLWAERTFILFGDTYYDRKTMDLFCVVVGLRAFWTGPQFLGFHWDNDSFRQQVMNAMTRAVSAKATAKSPDSQQGMGYLNYSFHLLQGFRVIENPAERSGHRKDSPMVMEAYRTCQDFDYPNQYNDFLRYTKPDDLP